MLALLLAFNLDLESFSYTICTFLHVLLRYAGLSDAAWFMPLISQF